MGNGEIVVIIPTLNEAKGVGPTLAELKGVLEDPCFLVIDANSADGTADVARKMDVEVFLQEGKGKGLAVAQVLNHVNSDTHYIVFIDADFTYPATYVPQMIKILEADSSVGMVLGNRFNIGFDLSKRASEVRKQMKAGRCYCPLANVHYMNMLLHTPTMLKIVNHALISRP
jgi:glycosyltransferase involved in cell wall biosynthesis